MNRRIKYSTRPQLETLDARQLLSATPTAVVMPLAVQAAHVSTMPNPIAIESGSALKAAAPSAIKASSVVFDGTYTDSVVTIQNRSSSTVNFQIQWPGTAWTSYSLNPGATRLYYIKGANLTALIRYDWSYQPGYQQQEYQLASKNFTAGGFAELTPSHATDGKQYYFITNSAHTGLAFYHV